MEKKKICFIAQFPPPIHGLSKAVEILYQSELQALFDFEKIDISNNLNFIKNLKYIRESNANLFYFTISQTRLGNLRDLIILNVLKMQHKKCVVHLHGGYYRQLVDHKLSKWQRQANYHAISQLDGAVVLGPSLKKNFMGMLPVEKIYVVPNCIEEKYLINDEQFEAKLSLINDGCIKHVLYLSNFIASKGYRQVLELAKIEKEMSMQNNKQTFHFDFAGDFFDVKEKKYFWNYINQNNLTEYVTYHGIVTGKQKQELLKKCEIFVLMTRYPKEGQPISILEAMGNGMAVITTDHAGIPDIIEDQKNGIVVSRETNMKVLYQEMHINSEKLKTIMRRNRKNCKENYNQKLYIKNIGKIFSGVANNE